MNRRDFIQESLLYVGVAATITACKQPSQRVIPGRIVGASASVGHLLRDGRFPDPVSQIEKEVVIVGGGVSGLSAARQLVRKGITDIALLDLEEKVGGNAASGSNSVSAYPWGAHYLPIPNTNLTEYMDFLTEIGVISGTDAQGLPIYNDYYLCFDPQERLYIHGRWQEGLVPQAGVPEADRQQIDRFLALMDHYRYLIGKDGKEAFALPVDRSSKDPELVLLDQLTMQQWMEVQRFTSAYLHWYVNYCTRDDFGTRLQEVSAWAGIHYFACRKGKGVGVSHQDVLTWPEGNGWLVGQLQRSLPEKPLTRSVVTRIQTDNEAVVVHYYDVFTKEVKAIRAQQCIVAVPQFIAARLLNDTKRIAQVQKHLHYVPWMVANLKVKRLEERNGAPLSWDNVLYESESLGYINATHELVSQPGLYQNLTYYLPLTKNSPLMARRAAQAKTHAEWVSEIFQDLEKVHVNLAQQTEEVNIMLWGHAMVQPLPGLIHGAVREELSASIGNRIHFAHTDLAGVSLFEEGFYQGLQAANKVMNQLT